MTRRFETIEGGKASRPGRRTISLHPDDYEDKIPASEFIVPSSDVKGHSAKVEALVPTPLAHELAVHLASKVFPFKTQAEIVRWAVYRGLEALAKLSKDNELSNVRAQVGAMVAAARLQSDMLDFEATVAQIGRTLRRLRVEGAHRQARKLLREIREYVEAMDDPDWKAKYEKVIREEFEQDESEGS